LASPKATYNANVKVAGVPRIRIQDVRYTSATLQIEQGARIPEVSKRLGQARQSTTGDLYGHVTEGMEPCTWCHCTRRLRVENEVLSTIRDQIRDHASRKPLTSTGFFSRAGDESRTRNIDLGRVALYQLSYPRERLLCFAYAW
jgi:hypothetical protein